MFLDWVRLIPDSAFARAVDPDGDGLWTVDSYLLANVIDALQVANWQRSADGAKGRKQPKPFPRPSDKHIKADKAARIKAAIEERARRRAQQQRG